MRRVSSAASETIVDPDSAEFLEEQTTAVRRVAIPMLRHVRHELGLGKYTELRDSGVASRLEQVRVFSVAGLRTVVTLNGLQRERHTNVVCST